MSIEKTINDSGVQNLSELKIKSDVNNKGLLDAGGKIPDTLRQAIASGDKEKFDKFISTVKDEKTEIDNSKKEITKNLLALNSVSDQFVKEITDLGTGINSKDKIQSILKIHMEALSALSTGIESMNNMNSNHTNDWLPYFGQQDTLNTLENSLQSISRTHFAALNNANVVNKILKIFTEKENKEKDKNDGKEFADKIGGTISNVMREFQLTKNFDKMIVEADKMTMSLKTNDGKPVKDNLTALNFPNVTITEDLRKTLPLSIQDSAKDKVLKISGTKDGTLQFDVIDNVDLTKGKAVYDALVKNDEKFAAAVTQKNLKDIRITSGTSKDGKYTLNFTADSKEGFNGIKTELDYKKIKDQLPKDFAKESDTISVTGTATTIEFSVNKKVAETNFVESKVVDVSAENFTEDSFSKSYDNIPFKTKIDGLQGETALNRSFNGFSESTLKAVMTGNNENNKKLILSKFRFFDNKKAANSPNLDQLKNIKTVGKNAKTGAVESIVFDKGIVATLREPVGTRTIQLPFDDKPKANEAIAVLNKAVKDNPKNIEAARVILDKKFKELLGMEKDPSKFYFAVGDKVLYIKAIPQNSTPPLSPKKSN